MSYDNTDGSSGNDPDDGSEKLVAHVETHQQVDTQPAKPATDTTQQPAASSATQDQSSKDQDQSSKDKEESGPKDTSTSILPPASQAFLGGGMVAAKQIYTQPSRTMVKVAKGFEKQAAKNIETAEKVAKANKTVADATDAATKAADVAKASKDAHVNLKASPDSHWWHNRKAGKTAAVHAKAEAAATKTAAKATKEADKVAKAAAKQIKSSTAKYEGLAKQAERAGSRASKAVNLQKDLAVGELKTVASKSFTDSSALSKSLKAGTDVVNEKAFLARGGEMLEGSSKAFGALGTAAKIGGRAFVAGAVVVSAYEVVKAAQTGDSKKVLNATGDAVGSLAGGWAGVEAGMAAGAAIGAISGVGIGAVPGALIGGLVGGIGGTLGGGWGGRKLAAMAVGAPGSHDATHGTSVNAKQTPKTSDEWTAINMERLKNYDFQGNNDDMNNIAKAYGFEGGIGQAHYALNTWKVQTAGEMKTIMQAASDANLSTDQFLSNRNGHEVALALSTPEKRPQSASPADLQLAQGAGGTPSVPAAAADLVSAVATVPGKYLLTSSENFADHADMAQQLEAAMKTAKDPSGKLYSEYDDVKNAPAALQATWALQHFLQDKGFYNGVNERGHPDTVDGLMGERTRMAAREYMKKYGDFTGEATKAGFELAELNTLGKTLGANAVVAGQNSEATVDALPASAVPLFFSSGIRGDYRSTLASTVPQEPLVISRNFGPNYGTLRSGTNESTNAAVPVQVADAKTSPLPKDTKRGPTSPNASV